MIQIALRKVQNGFDKLKLNFDYNGTNNYGNVQSQTINVPTVRQNQGFTAVQTYSYDSLNRLKSATENINGNQTPSWKQAFVYDRFGNRRFDEANTTVPSSFSNITNPQILPATNPSQREKEMFVNYPTTLAMAPLALDILFNQNILFPLRHT